MRGAIPPLPNTFSLCGALLSTGKTLRLSTYMQRRSSFKIQGPEFGAGRCINSVCESSNICA